MISYILSFVDEISSVSVAEDTHVRLQKMALVHMRNDRGNLRYLNNDQKNTVGHSTYERIKHDIIFGHLEPGTKLKLEGLKTH